MSCKDAEKGRVLIITQTMIPYTDHFGSCQRMYYLADHLAAAGYAVTVMAPKSGKRNPSLKNCQCDFEICWLEDMKLYRIPVFRKPVFTKLSKIIFNDLGSGEDFSTYLWCISSRKKISEFIQEHGITKVIISGPSFVLFSLAGMLKKDSGDLKVILDYRDPWNLWNGKAGISKYMENRYQKHSDCIVCFSEKFKTDMEKVFPACRGKYQVVYNGFSEKMWNRIPEEDRKGDRLIFQYAGNITLDNDESNYRNPNPLLNAFLKVSADKNMELCFTGVDTITGRMKQLMEASGGKIRFVCKVPVEEALQQMHKSDILIAIHDGRNLSDRYILSAKLFDYIRSGRMIWNLGSEKSAMSRFLISGHLGKTSANEESRIEQQLKKFYRQWEAGSLPSGESVRVYDTGFYSREHQNEVFTKIMERL